MIQVTQSPFLQALGYAILNSLWQFAFLWLIYLFINCVVKLSSHNKYTAATALQLSGFAWFSGTLVFYYNQCLSTAYAGAGIFKSFEGNLRFTYAASVKDNLLVAILRVEQFLPYLSIAYLFLLIVLGFKWVKSYNHTRELKTTGLKRIAVEQRLFVDRLCHQMGIKRSVKVFLSNLITGPLTIGFLKPIILVPLASINQLTTNQLEAVLLHELAHIKRFDYLANLVLSVVEVALFFNPFMQLISRHIKRERENSCDDWVLQYEYNAATYARALLQLATCTSKSASFAMNAVDQNHTLLLRVKRMIEKNDRSFNYRNQLVALLFISGVLSSVAWFAPTTSKKSSNIAVENSKTYVAEPLVASVTNPFFNPVFFLVNNERELLKVAFTKEKEDVSTTFAKIPKGNAGIVYAHIPNQTNVILPPVPPLSFLNDQTETVNATNMLNNLQWKFDTLQLKNDLSNLSNNMGNDWILANKELSMINNEMFSNKTRQLSLAPTVEKLKKQLDKAVQQLADLSHLNQKENFRMAELSKKAAKLAEEAAVKFREHMFEKEEIRLLNNDVQKQLERVNYQPAQDYDHQTQFQRYEAPTIIFSTPNIEAPHTYSYDYTDKSFTGYGAITATPGSKPVTVKIIVGCKETAVPNPPKINVDNIPSPPARTVLQGRKIIKIIRI